MKAIIDADGILYRACANVKDVDQALKKYSDIVKQYMKDAWLDPKKDQCVQFVGGRGNWRKDIFPEYKAHRIKKEEDPKKLMEQQIRYDLLDLLKDSHMVIPSNGCEADDLVRRSAMNCLLRGQEYVVISADKDLDMVEGQHLRPNQWGETKEYFIGPEESDYNYFKQVLMGDMQDNIRSPHLLGEKAALKLLDNNSRGSWRSLIQKEYMDRCGSEWEHALYFTGSLVHIQRAKDDHFSWNKEDTWWTKGFKTYPSCYKYTDKQLGRA